MKFPAYIPEPVKDSNKLQVEWVLNSPKLPLPEADEIIYSIRYAWEKSPPVSYLLNTIKEAAENFKPQYISEMVQTATSSRKSNTKTEYIRAFASSLIENGFKITPKVMKVMAITANVVINSPEIDTSYDNVRKVVKSLEDSA